MSNPLLIAGAVKRGRRRTRVGAEFVQCADGSWVGRQHIADCATRGGLPGGDTGGGGFWSPPNNPPPNTGGWTPPPGGSGSGGGTPYTPPSGGGGGTPYTPPSGGGGGTPTPTIPTPTGCAPIVQVCPENLKRYVMPFVPDAGFTVAVAAGATARFVGKPQKMFKPDRLIIASTIAPYFDVVNFIIANVPQSLSQGNVPADIYSEVSTYTLMTFDQAYPGIDVILSVTNKSSVSQNFQATLVGEAVG